MKRHLSRSRTCQLAIKGETLGFSVPGTPIKESTEVQPANQNEGPPIFVYTCCAGVLVR